ncbi:MAG: hypothetical protein AAF741_17255 [Bacteroidota bacterium]
MPKIFLVVMTEDFVWDQQSQLVYAQAGVRMIEQYSSLGICRVEADSEERLNELPGVISVEEEQNMHALEEE